MKTQLKKNRLRVLSSLYRRTTAVHTNPKRQRGRQAITSLTLRVSRGSLIIGRARSAPNPAL